ncbi:phage holin family protein [Enterovirga rhinocerotis]|uniref:Putative superfamily III holin-X n=1 Tax=Enterovirga rhinocerotis TaxID=1339210 RepID=A0A4R7C5R7_9HYPH|nr:phage holin family protein [Enterovirga rhinocerotis]TDR93242.1 putative superfamily III holin-X [Enterovirga rhinocerotis]
MAEPGPSLQDLVGAVFRDGASLARTELSLFKAEMASNATGFAKGAGMFLAASVFAVASLIWLTQALVYGLEIVTGSKWISALIVGGLLAVIALVLILIGRRYVSAASLTPARTARSVRRDADILSERAAP